MVEDDLEPLITKCPSCSTQFRVTENQLAVAGGRVRCGACLTVFQGTEHLLLEEASAFATDSEADAALDELLHELNGPEGLDGAVPDAPSPSVSTDLEDAEDPEAVFASSDEVNFPRQLYGGFEEKIPSSLEEISEEDSSEAAGNPAADETEPAADSTAGAMTKQERSAAESGQLAAETDAFAEAQDSTDPELTSSSGPSSSSEGRPTGQDGDQAGAEDGTDLVDEAWFDVDYVEWVESESGKVAALEQPPENIHTASRLVADAGGEPDDPVGDASRRWLATAVAEDDGPDPRDDVDWIVSDHGAASGRPHSDQSAAATAAHEMGEAALQSQLDATLDEHAITLAGGRQSPGGISFAREPRRWWVGGVMALFLLALAGQIFYFQQPEWSLEPGLRPLYETTCRWLGCELPVMRDQEALSTRNLVVRSHPELEGALIVDVIILNQADFDQPFPGLDLRFTALNGQLVASRQFQPDEYLGGELEGQRLMPSKTPIQVSLEIEDPGRDAVNYTLRFR